MKNLLLKLVCFMVLGLFYPSNVFAFVDEFNSQSSLDNYDVSINSGNVVVESGKLILSAPSSAKHFPYVSLKNQHIGEHVESISIDFRYSHIGIFGAGIIIDDNYPVNGDNYDVGSNSIVWTWNWGAPPKLRLGMYPFIHSEIFNQTGLHNLKISGSPGMYEIYFDDIFQGTTNSSKQIDSLWFGNPDIVSTTSSWPVIEIDRIQINNAVVVPTFPYLSQRDPAWKDLPYDNASVWAGAQANTIERWGCAITSVAMVLKEYGVKMPNGDEANPDKINSWLLSQPDGYVGNGLLNWLAISRMTRESRESGHSDKDLEFTKSFDPPSDDLTAGLFPIIDEGGHFVTLYDQSDDSYLLNDPNNATRSSKLKSELIRSVNTYKPSNTDLSYIMIVADPLIDINVKYTGSLIGTKYDEEVHDDVGGGSTGPGRILYIPKPFAGDYTLIVNNTKPAEGSIKIFSYDKDGNVDVTTQSVIPGTSSWVLSYNPDGTDPTISELDTTPPTFTGTNSFNGWYNTPQTAIFSFADPNLPSDFVSPACIINKEGINRTCSVNVLVCDKYNNCATHNLKSNPANIDLTPPGMVKHIWSIGMRPFSLVSWTPSRDALKYIVEWGTEKNAISNRIESRDSWQWLPTPKIKQLYVKITVVDRAGNLSNASKLEKINVHPYYWRW